MCDVVRRAVGKSPQTCVHPTVLTGQFSLLQGADEPERLTTWREMRGEGEEERPAVFVSDGLFPCIDWASRPSWSLSFHGWIARDDGDCPALSISDYRLADHRVGAG